MLELFTLPPWSQSDTNNGFFKLVEALLQICSCCFSHSIKLYVACRYQQCDCLAALPAKISVFTCHMQGSHSIIPNKPRLHPKKHIGTINVRKAGKLVLRTNTCECASLYWNDNRIQSDLVYPDYFGLSNTVGLARYSGNRNHKYEERNSFQSKCQQFKQRCRCAVQ